LRVIVNVIGRQRGHHDLAGVGVNAKVQLPPTPSRARAVLLHQPLAGTAQLQAGDVDKQMHGRAARCTGRTTGNVSARRLSVE